MVPYHGINHDQYGAASDALKQNIGKNPVLSENLQSLVPLVAKEIVKLEVQADRHEFIRDVYNEYDMGYGENVRVAFENAVLAHSMTIRPDYRSEPTLEFIHEAFTPVNESNAKMGWNKGTKSSRNEYKAKQSLNKASDVTTAIDRRISGKAGPKTKNIHRKASSGNKQYKAAKRAGVSWLKEETPVNESNAKMGWNKGTKSSRNEYKAKQSLNKASDVTTAIDRRISGKAGPKTKNIHRKASSGNKQYKAAKRAGVSWLKEEEAINEILPLVESLSDLDFDALLLVISEDQKQSIFNLMEQDLNNTIEVILEDLDTLSDEDLDSLDITEDDLETIDDLYEILDDVQDDEEEELSEGIFSDAKAAASSAKNNKKTTLNRSAASRARLGNRNRAGLIKRGVNKLQKIANKASVAYGKASYAAGNTGRNIRAAASGAKAYGSAVKTGVKNAVTNAARRAKDSVVNKFNKMKSGVSNGAKAAWRGIKRFGSKIASKAKYAVGKGVNALRSAGDYAKKVDAKRSGANTPIAKAKAGNTLRLKLRRSGKYSKPTKLAQPTPKPAIKKRKTSPKAKPE
jgi:hypothetical protein